jgi:hypothetical protein
VSHASNIEEHTPGCTHASISTDSTTGFGVSTVGSADGRSTNSTFTLDPYIGSSGLTGLTIEIGPAGL